MSDTYSEPEPAPAPESEPEPETRTEPEPTKPYLRMTTTWGDGEVVTDTLNIERNQALRICHYRGELETRFTRSRNVPPTMDEASKLDWRTEDFENRCKPADTVITLVTRDGETIIEAPQHFITDPDSVPWYKDVPPSVTHRRRPCYNPALPTVFPKSNTRSLLEDPRGRRGNESSKSGTATVPDGK